MARMGLEREIVDAQVYRRTVERFRERRIALPKFAWLAEPQLAAAIAADPDAADPRNLFRVHWHNNAARTATTAVPEFLELPSSLTGVPARIVLALGRYFPMIRAHKVLAAYGCLVPRLVTGQFDPTHHKAVWPSTGNYCRGGVAISRILGCRGIAVLPEGMSRERFEWLDRWVADPADVIRTPGSESNVKEIYDECAALDRSPDNVIFNQFCEFANHLVHYSATGAALARVFEHLRADRPDAKLRAFVAATGSGGAIAAGDYLKDAYGSQTVAVEALECPTLLYNGFGEHNIQGIGDKHVPYIHNVMQTDAIAGISDADTDELDLVFNHAAGRRYLVERRGVPEDVVARLDSLGFSSICNMLGAIRTAKYNDLGPDDVVMALATDGAELYGTEHASLLDQRFGGEFDAINAAEIYGRAIQGASTAHYLEMRVPDRHRVFNLGYYTWVEQQGVSVEDFERRRHQGFWRDLRNLLPIWDDLIERFNAETGVIDAGA